MGGGSASVSELTTRTVVFARTVCARYRTPPCMVPLPLARRRTKRARHHAPGRVTAAKTMLPQKCVTQRAKPMVP